MVRLGRGVMSDYKRKRNFGNIDYEGKGPFNTLVIEYELTQKEKGLAFSASGIVWNKYKTDAVACGQMLDDEHVFAQVENFTPEMKDLYHRILKVWQRWHLNDMNAGCSHQRDNWDLTGKVLGIVDLGSSHSFYNLTQKVGKGELSIEEYREFMSIAPTVRKAMKAKYLTPEVLDLIDKDYLRVDKTDYERNTWVKYEEHPEGLLCKPCEECGYKYGSKWVFEEIPQDVIDEIKSWEEIA